MIGGRWIGNRGVTGQMIGGHWIGNRAFSDQLSNLSKRFCTCVHMCSSQTLRKCNIITFRN